MSSQTVDDLAAAWLTAAAGRFPLLPLEMKRLRLRVETDPPSIQARKDNHAVAAEFMADDLPQLNPVDLRDYNPNNTAATLNNNLCNRFLAGWEACAWEAALTGDRAALDRAAVCLRETVETHRQRGAVRIVPGPDADPSVRYYLAGLTPFRPEQVICLVELMRGAGWNDPDLMRNLVERLLALAELALQACRHLCEDKRRYGNWDTCAASGLLATVAVLRTHPKAADLEDTAWRSLSDYFGRPWFLCDGTYYEAFPCAEGYGLSFLFPALLALRGTRALDLEELRFSPVRTLRESMEWHLKVASPLGESPTINDNNSYESLMGEGNRGYFHIVALSALCGLNEAWEVLRTGDYALPLYLHGIRDQDELRRSCPASEPSFLLPDVGWTFLRSDWSRGAFYVMFDHGRHGNCHTMPQCLTFDLTCYGHHWLVNSGTAPHYCTYPEQQTWHQTTRAGNCIVVEGRDAAKSTGKLLKWERGEDGRIEVSACHVGYDEVTHTRTLIFCPDQQRLDVRDELESRDGARHPAEVVWHVNAEPLQRLSGQWAFAGPERHLLTISSPLLTPDSRVGHGPCGGLGGRNRYVGRLPGWERLQIGDPGWVSVPYLILPMEVPATGSIVVATSFCVL